MSTPFCNQSKVSVIPLLRNDPSQASGLCSETSDAVVSAKEASGSRDSSVTISSSGSRVSSDGRSPDGCRTPSGEVFDSFAPGSDFLNLVPKRHSQSDAKILTFGNACGSLSKSRISRVLKFNEDQEEEVESELIDAREEKEFLEHICNDLLNAILSMHMEESAVKNDSFPSPKTPRHAIKRIVDSWDDCPPAPIRPREERSVASETLDSLCRRLEF